MIRILLFSDIHLHPHKNSFRRLQDCIDVLRWTFSIAKQNGITDVIFLGDLFHDRQKIQVVAYHSVFEVFWEFRDLKVKLLLGNHDIWFYDKCDVSSVTPLSGLPNVEIISTPQTVKVGNLDVDFIPFTHNPMEAIRSFATKSRILCGHLAVDNAILNKYHNTRSEVSIESDKDVVSVTSDVFQGWERVFLGHYHIAQKLNNQVEYVGSPLQLSFNEAHQDKHVILLDEDTLETEYVVNHFSPKHLILEVDEIEKVDTENNFVQILVDDTIDVLEVKKKIVSQTLEFKDVKRKSLDECHEELQAKFDIAEGDVLDRYVETVNIGELEKAKLLSIGREIILEN